MSSQKSPFISSALFIAGTAIGAGTIAWPSAAAQYSVTEAIVMMFIVYVVMMLTGLILAKISIEHPNRHLLSMAQRYLGLKGSIPCAISFLFISFGSLVAYWVGLREVLQFSFPSLGQGFFNAAIFICAYGILSLRSSISIPINSLLFFIMVLIFASIIYYLNAFSFPTISWATDFSHFRWMESIKLIPILLTCFSYHVIIPGLATHHQNNPKSLYGAIIVGVSISFMIYLIWLLSICGHSGNNELNHLAQTYAKGNIPLDGLIYGKSKVFVILMTLFSFLATTTSFIGIAMATRDFLSEPFKLAQFSSMPTIVRLFVIVPPLIIGLNHSDYYIKALEATGLYGDTLLSCIFPIVIFIIYLTQNKNARYVFSKANVG